MICIGQKARSVFARAMIAFCAAVGVLALGSGSADAQTSTPFGGGFDYESGRPIEISADSLEVRNEQSMAIFRGSVRVRQGEVVMTARELRVTYASNSTEGAIDRLEAIGGVVITNGEDTAGSERADYDIARGEVVMSGDVILTQCRSEIAGDRLRINLDSGTANMEGRTVVRIRQSPDC